MHTALRYAAGGFAEAKGKYRGSIVEAFAVVPIGCRIAQDLDDEVRIAGINGSFWQYCLYLCMHMCVCMHTTDVCTALCPPTGYESRSYCISHYHISHCSVVLLLRAAAYSTG